MTRKLFSCADAKHRCAALNHLHWVYSTEHFHKKSDHSAAAGNNPTQAAKAHLRVPVIQYVCVIQGLRWRPPSEHRSKEGARLALRETEGFRLAKQKMHVLGVQSGRERAAPSLGGGVPAQIAVRSCTCTHIVVVSVCSRPDDECHTHTRRYMRSWCTDLQVGQRVQAAATPSVMLSPRSSTRFGASSGEKMCVPLSMCNPSKVNPPPPGPGVTHQ